MRHAFKNGAKELILKWKSIFEIFFQKWENLSQSWKSGNFNFKPIFHVKNMRKWKNARCAQKP